MAQLGICDSAIVALTNILPLQTSKFSPAGALQASLDPDATLGLEILNPSKGDGYASMVELTPGNFTPRVRIRQYRPRINASKKVKDCVTTPAPNFTETNFDIADYLQRDFFVSNERIRSLCDDANQVANGGTNPMRFNLDNTAVMNEVAQMFLAEMRQMIKDLNTSVVTALATPGWNRRTGNATPQNVALFNAGLGTIRNDGFSRMVVDMNLNEVSGTPLVIGGDMFAMFNTNKSWSQLANTGINFEKLDAVNPVKAFYEPSADTAWGTNQIRAIAPGVMKLVTYTKYEGIFKGQAGTSDFGTFVMSEYPDLTFDLKATYNDCSEGYSFFISLTYDVFKAPSRYQTGDTHQNVNGIFGYVGVSV